MSLTSTETTPRRPKTIMLSPSKRHGAAPNSSVPSRLPRKGAILNPEGKPATPAEIWKWCLTPAAAARCFVRDACAMGEHAGEGFEYYLLGRVPCRTLLLVGVMVGLSEYESRAIYQVDDGTGVINCVVRYPALAGKGVRSEERPPPKPVAEVGQLVRLAGRIHVKGQWREIVVDQISVCKSMDEELAHWRTVIALHKESYSSTEPFVIASSLAPPAKVVKDTVKPPANRTWPEAAPDDQDAPNRQDSVEHRIVALPKATTEQNALKAQTSRSAYVPTSPSTSAASSPTKSAHDPSSPPRLRHPSRLHSRDLTANTFRIYLKHYMDNAPPHDEPRGVDSDSESDSDAFAPHDRAPATPTKRGRGAGVRPRFMDECTPRARKVARGDAAFPPAGDPSRTPRGGRLAAREREDADAAGGAPLLLGFTLSYLRRVPELAVLAQRVVRAEARRREKAARGASQRQASAAGVGAGNGAGEGKGKGKGKGKAVEARKEGVRPKMKRLFIWAILKLYEEGSIVLWDEGARPILRARGTVRRRGGEAVEGVSQLWKMSVGVGGDASADGASSVFGGGGGGGQDGEREDDAGELTDPWEGEEAYVPLTPAYLAAQVEGVIRVAMFGPEAAAAGGSASARARVGRREVRGSGLTVEGITRSLRASDGRWERVGAWAVQEAVGLLKAEGKVWCVGGDGGGRWELCL